MARATSFVLLAVVGLALVPIAVGRSESRGRVILGSRISFPSKLPYDTGWGTSHPVAIDNGGDPTGRAWSLRWRSWGSATATAAGFTYLEPTTTRNWRKGRVQLRATRIGHCSSAGPRAYTRLYVRVAELRSGSWSAWFLWNLRPNLCHPERPSGVTP
jgi:hypothetical protein